MSGPSDRRITRPSVRPPDPRLTPALPHRPLCGRSDVGWRVRLPHGGGRPDGWAVHHGPWPPDPSDPPPPPLTPPPALTDPCVTGLTSGDAYDSRLTVDGRTGELSITAPLDRETDQTIRLHVECRLRCGDDDDGVMTMWRNFTMTVLDRNDHGPVIVRRFGSVHTFDEMTTEPATLLKVTLIGVCRLV